MRVSEFPLTQTHPWCVLQSWYRFLFFIFFASVSLSVYAMEICMFHGLILQIACRPLSPPRQCSACPYLPESTLQGCPCPASVPPCQTFISQHPNGSVTQHKHSSVTRHEIELPQGFTQKFVFTSGCHHSTPAPAFDIYYRLLTYIVCILLSACYMLHNVPGRGAIWMVAYVFTCQR